ncbi:hypothetical protein [Burkholderia pseudomallei]|uniref:hypothetical protein n=1 Tax=Burkholderia pseudomallei TaxID=28450 RepID=UPI001325E919|nr:hypothetical protein [Burkholderia pseudomallei]MWA18067.1 hypothetical protein [Burkholderia pseudomallei]
MKITDSKIDTRDIPELSQEDVDAGWLPINPDGSFPFPDEELGTGFEKTPTIQ